MTDMRHLYDLGYTYQQISDLMGRRSCGSIFVQCKNFPGRQKITISLNVDLYTSMEKTADTLGICINGLMIQAIEQFIREAIR